MNRDQRPHSRDKKVGQGSADVEKGKRVDNGKRPVGMAGGRNDNAANNQNRESSGGTTRLSLKNLIILAVVVIVGFSLMKKCGVNPTDVIDTSGSGTAVTDLLGSLTGGDNGSTGSGNIGTSSGAGSSQSGAPDFSVSSEARAKRVVPVGGGKDIVTVMVYMCGTDLESKYGMATKDLAEMTNANIADNVNLIVFTGGCKKWQNNAISSSKNQIFKVVSGGVELLEDNMGTAAMTDPANLTNFIRYCDENYPADRNMLIMWDHGGGSLSGYGYDEKKPGASSMTLAKFDKALADAGCTFDCIGFDACLMATLETALVCNKYADYMLAYEEVEPGTGWYYTDWINKLSKNTSAPTLDIASQVIDDFIYSSSKDSPNAKVTLSVIDLAELQGTVPDALSSFATSTNKLLQSDDYKQVSDARAGVRQFSAENKLNQVDLVDLANRIGTKESKALAKALQGCIKYNQSTMTRCYGLSVYFPYETTGNVKNAVASYNALGMDDEYTKCIQNFASIGYGGQIVGSASQTQTADIGGDLLGSLLDAYAGSGSSSNPVGSLLGSFMGGSSSSGAGSLLGGLLGGSSSSAGAAGMGLDPSMILNLLGGFSGRSMPVGYDWVNTDLIADSAEYISKNSLNPARLTATDKNGEAVLSLTDDEWALIETVELNVFADDGDGFIDLGLDNTFKYDDDDDLLLKYDGTWLTLNGKVCSYYLVSDTEQDDGSWVTVGRIPARLNDELVNLCVVFDSENCPYGTVTGAYPLYDDDDVAVRAKGNIEVVPGDTIELLCDYYDYDGEYSDFYTLGTEFTVPEEGLVLENLKLNVEGVSVTYRITDIYGNHFWVPVKY